MDYNKEDRGFEPRGDGVGLEDEMKGIPIEEGNPKSREIGNWTAVLMFLNALLTDPQGTLNTVQEMHGKLLGEISQLQGPKEASEKVFQRFAELSQTQPKVWEAIRNIPPEARKQ